MSQIPAGRGAMSLLAAVALALLLGALALHSYAGDLDRLLDADLSNESEVVPRERNALTPLLEAMKNLRYPDDYIDSADTIDLAVIGAAWDPDWVETILRENETAMNHYRRALAAPDFQVRVRSVQGERQVLDHWLMLAKFRALEARVQGMRGDGSGALDATLDLANFGARTREIDGGRLVHYLTGTSVIRVALEALQRILKDVALDPERAREILGALEALRLDREGWSQIARGDYQWTKGVLDESVEARVSDERVASRDPFAREVLESIISLSPLWYSFQRNRTLLRLGDHYRASMAAMPATCREWGVHKHGAEMLPRAPALFSIERNALGNYWADLAHTSIQLHRRTSCVSESNLSAVQVMVALRAFELDRDRMPLALDELVPDFFAEVPRDYFDGDAIRYAPNRHLIYSVGSDLVDAQGQRSPGEACNAELSFPIPFDTRQHVTALPVRLTCGVSRS